MVGFEDEGLGPVDEAGFVMPKPRRNVRRVVWTVVLLLLAAAVLLYLFRGVFSGPPPVYAETGYVTTGEILQHLSTSGTITTAERVTVFCPVTAPLTLVNAELGGLVTEGQQLFAFDTTTFELNLRQAQANSTLGGLQKQQALAADADNRQEVADSQASVDNLEIQKANAEATLQKAAERYAEQQVKLQPKIEEAQLQITALQIEIAAGGNDATAEQKAELKKLSENVAKWQGKLTALSAEVSAAQSDVAYQTELLATMRSINESTQKALLDNNQKQQLNEQQVPTQVALENAQRNLEKAQAGVVAPISGVVTSLPVEVGGTVSQNASICVIESRDKVDVVITLSRYDLERVQLGQAVKIETLGREYSGTVRKINAMATQSGGTGMVSTTIGITAPDEGIVLGLEAQVQILTAEVQDAVRVPIAAVNTDVNGSYVFVVENNVARRVNIEIGISSDTWVEVLSGLSGGEAVALNAYDLNEGDTITDDPSYAPAGGGILDLIGG